MWLDFEASRWVSQTVNIGLEAAAGTSYAFGTYSEDLRNKTAISQSELQQIKSWGDIGLYFAVIAGIIFDNYGPRPTLMLGIVLSLSGYLLMYYEANKGAEANCSLARITYPRSLIALYTFMWSNGGAAYDCCAMGTSMRNFPDDRGQSAGLLKSFMGLSASIVTLIYSVFYEKTLKEVPDDGSGEVVFVDSLGILNFLGYFSGVVGLLGLLFVKVVPFEDARGLTPSERRVFFLAMFFMMALGGFLITIIILLDKSDSREESEETKEIKVVAMYILVPLLLMQGVLLIPWLNRKLSKSEFVRTRSAESPIRETRSAEADLSAGIRDTNPPAWFAANEDQDTSAKDSTPLLKTVKRQGKATPPGYKSVSLAEMVGAAAPSAVRGSGDSLKDICTSLDFWIMNIVILFGTGSGLTFINNVAQQVKALNGPAESENDAPAQVHVVLISVGNSIGRLFWGFMSDRFRNISRSGWLTITTFAASLSMFIAAKAEPEAMYPAAAIVGFTYGGYWALIPGILADMYGTRWFAATYSLIALCPALGSYIFSGTMAARLYEIEIDSGTNTCFGKKCFETTYLILGSLCIFGFGLGCWLTWRVRDLTPKGIVGLKVGDVESSTPERERPNSVQGFDYNYT